MLDEWQARSGKIMLGMFHHFGVEAPGDCGCRIDCDKHWLVTAWFAPGEVLLCQTVFPTAGSRFATRRRLGAVEGWLFEVVRDWSRACSHQLL